MEHLDPVSSDEEYFPTAEELDFDDDETMDSDEGEEEEGEEGEEEQVYFNDLYDAENINEVRLNDEEVEAHVERILFQSTPGFLHQIQRVFQQGIRIQGGSSRYEDPSPRYPRRRLPDLPPPPFKAGKHLLYSGEFGEIDDRRAKKRQYESPRTMTQFARFRELGWRRESMVPISKKWIPAELKGRIVAHFFYTASQDSKCRMYQTLNPANPRDWKLYKTVRGEIVKWTITDATLSRDNRYLAYSSMSPYVYFARTGSTSSMEADAGESWKDEMGPGESQIVLDFSGYNGVGRLPRYHTFGFDRGRMDPRTGIWSLRFSADGRELIVGASDQCLYVYDIEMRKITLRLEGHTDEINAVCFADPLATNVLFSGSDDSVVKVWDRRSMAGGREAGCLPGHMEGITFVATKGDGRYVISNSKDQTLKLWDIRKMMERSDFDALPRKDYCSGFDYRWMDYPGPRLSKHPNDCSVTTYTGHRVLKTLIRCHFSPPSSTGQQFLYSGSSDGRVHIWNLDGTVERVIDVGQSLSKTCDRAGPEEIEWGFHSLRSRRRKVNAVVRDVSWHPYEGVLVSSSWTSIAGESGAVTVHAWDNDR